MSKKVLCTTLFAISIAIILLPMSQECFFRFNIKPLNGEWNRIEKPKLTFDSYKSNKYQQNVEKYISENFGFREILLRVYNEFLWDFFRKTHVNYIERGDSDWLFYKNEINSYYGKFQLSKFKSNQEATAKYDNIALNMWKLREVLKDFDIEFITFLTPEKCRLYSQYLPKYEYDTTTVNTIQYFKENFKKYDIPCLDMTELFENIGDTIPFPLIGPYGAHWNFSCVYGIDSLLQYAGSLMDTKIAKIRCGELKPYDRETTKENIQDFDAEGMLNLLFKRDHSDFQLYKADVKYVSDSTCKKPSFLFVGNSFFWRPLDLIEFDSVLSNRRFWYYNNTSFTKNNSVSTSKLDYLNELLQSDCIVTFCNETQLHEMSFGFINKALVTICVSDSIIEKKTEDICKTYNVSKDRALEEIYKNPSLIPELAGNQIPAIRNEKAIERFSIISEIKSDSKWLETLEGHAKYRKKSVQNIVIEEMNNIIDKKPLLKDMDVVSCEEQFNKIIEDILNSFKNDDKKTKLQKKKAKEQGIAYEEMLQLDVMWVINNNEQYYISKIYNNK